MNTSLLSVEVNLYFKASGGTSRNLIPKDMEMDPKSLAVMDEEVTLEAADVIEGDASSASTVDFVMSGVENS